MSTSTIDRTEYSQSDQVGMVARSASRALQRIVREPLVHFLLLGAVILAASAILNIHRVNAARRIVIDKQLIVHFVTLYQAQMGTLPSKSQLDSMIEGYIREEVQFREAKRLGLDTDDEIVRRRLASKFDFVQRDLAAVPDPSAEQLQGFYITHQKDFLQPGNVTFTHIYFSPDHGGDPAALSRAKQALIALQSGTMTRAPGLGDHFPLQSDYSGVARLDLLQQFGDSPIVDSVFAVSINRWSGPVRSGYGWHLVYVSHREETKVPQLKQIQDKVRGAYIEDMKEKANQRKYEALEKQYVIDRAYLR